MLSRLRIGSPGPGYVHLPEWVDEEYLAQLTAEKAIRKYVKGRGAVREWVKLRERNEALALEIYSLAGLYILGQPLVRALPERAQAWARPAEAVASAVVPVERAPRRATPWIPKQRGWINGWRW